MTHPAPPDGKGGHNLVTLDGRYHIVERIAAGGMGEVFLAQDAVLAREVAIKVLHRSLSGDQAFVDRFRREARAAAGLSHPNVVAVYDWGAVDGVYYMVMEYVRGRATRELLNASGRLEPIQAAEVIRQTLLALEHAHHQGLVHRDIKPENILITTDGVVKVTDFGLARAYADGRQTQAGSVTGTVQYLAPEQIRGEPADPRSDLYSLGIVTYELLTGKLPFTGETAMSIAYKHLSDRVPRPSATVPSITSELDGFVTSATERDREMRPESASEMRRDIEALEPSLPPARSLAGLVGDMPEIVADAGETTEAVALMNTQTQTITRTIRTRRRRWRRTALVMLTVAALLAAAWGVWTYAIPHRATIPSFAGVTVDDARAQLEHLGFTVRIAAGRYTDGVGGVPAGQVLRVQPDTGTVLKKGETVMLIPSLGPPPVPVPTVTGKTLAEATQLLKTAGLVVGAQTQRYDKKIPLGSVISQSPSTGNAPTGSAVTLVISKGPPPTGVPDVTGRTKAAAKAKLKAAGFTVSVQTGFSDSVAKGRVISTSPIGGVTAPFGSDIQLTVSLGPSQFPCPDFTHMSVEAAKALADSYGLVIAAYPVPGATGTTVMTQLPAAGTVVPYGATITVYYL
jgi:eukaryotic-like serine/threonine-protein kinase